MRACLLLMFLNFAVPFGASAQQFRGRVSDAASAAPVSSALITNLRSGALWVSDSAGHVAFTAYPGDIVRFQHPGYKDQQLKISGYEDVISVAMVRAPVELAEVKVLSPMLRFKQDSIFNRRFFHKELGYTGSQVKMEFSNGIGSSGLISELALLASGKKKYYRRFAEEMNMLEELRYASIRYTPELVAAQTGLDDSAAAVFINQHPIAPDFVRTASELELKMWVRNQYRAALKSGDSVTTYRGQNGMAAH